MMLDVTAGNRTMWKSVGFNPPNVVFMDIETRLRIPPTLFGDNRLCPFRDYIFDCVFYDPPFVWSIAPWFLDPTNKKYSGVFYGEAKSKRQLLIDVHKVQKELQRLTKRICFKWGELRISLWKILPLFKEWDIKQIKEYKTPHHTSRIKGKSKFKTYWVTLVNSQFKENGESHGLEEKAN